MAAEQARPVTGSGLGPAYAAVRVRLGLVVALFAVAAVGWWWTVGQMQDMDEGPWTSLGAFGWFLGVWVVMMAANAGRRPLPVIGWARSAAITQAAHEKSDVDSPVFPSY